MAGGEGSRLRPVTCDIPKPMAPIASLPAMCHIIRLLKGCGVDEAVVTTMYLADEVEKIGSEFEGVRLKYLREETPLGTAGGVKRASADFEDDFIVISGDCICDFDLASAVEFHKSKKADCTILLAEKPYPLEYGVVMCGEDGRVSRFIEKPAWSQVFSDCVNTGIYIINPRVMDLVPENKKYDFAKDLFPRLIGGKMYGWRVEGYWCDVGSIKDYYTCNYDAATGKVGGIDKIPLYNGCIIPDDCDIKGDAQNTVFHSGVSVGRDSVIEGSIICRNAKIGQNVKINPGCVIGSGCVIENNCVIGQGVRIYAGIKIKKGSVVMRDIIRQSESTPMFTDSGICGSIKESLSPERCFALGAGCAVREGARVGVMCENDCGAVGTLVKNCIIGGVLHAGGVALDFGEGNRLLSAHAALSYRQDIMLYVEASGDGICIYTLGGDSLTLSRESERKIRSSLENGAKSGKNSFKPIAVSGIRELYISNLVRGKSSMKGLSCAVSDTPEGQMLAEALDILGAKVRLCCEKELEKEKERGKTCFEVDSERLEVYLGRDFHADFEHIRAYLVHHKAPAYKNIALPYTSPAVLNEIAHRRGARVFRYLTTPSGDSDIAARSLAADFAQLIFRDTCFMAMQLCENFCEMEFKVPKFKEAFGVIPPFYREMRDIDYDENKRARLMKTLADNPSPDTEGAQLIFSAGRALVIPKRTGGFRIIAEAASTEAAREITFETERKIYGKEK